MRINGINREMATDRMLGSHGENVDIDLDGKSETGFQSLMKLALHFGPLTADETFSVEMNISGIRPITWKLHILVEQSHVNKA